MQFVNVLDPPFVDLMLSHGNFYAEKQHSNSFWPTVLSVAPLVQCVVCLSVVCDVLYSDETAGPICMKFSGKVWSDHGTT